MGETLIDIHKQILILKDAALKNNKEKLALHLSCAALHIKNAQMEYVEEGKYRKPEETTYLP